MSRIRVTATDCWEWLGAKSGGYGYLNWQGKVQKTSRLSYTCFKADIPPGKVVCHRCDNPPCINPDHLFAGTHADNVADKMRKGRYVLPERKRGSKHCMAKLNETEVASIRRRGRSGEPRAFIASAFGICEGHVYSILSGRTWKHTS